MFCAERARRTSLRFARSGNGFKNWERRTPMRCRFISDASLERRTLILSGSNNAPEHEPLLRDQGSAVIVEISAEDVLGGSCRDALPRTSRSGDTGGGDHIS